MQGQHYKSLVHVTLEEHESEEIETCRDCKETMNLKSLANHMINLHGKVLKTTIFGFGGPEEETIKEWVVPEKKSTNGEVDVADEVESGFDCEICNANFKFKDVLKLHTYKHHTGKFPCSLCEYTYMSKKLPEDHYNNFHSDLEKSPPESNYKSTENSPELHCKICNKEFSQE